MGSAQGRRNQTCFVETLAEAMKERGKADPQKVKVAQRLRQETVKAQDWIAKRMEMGYRHTLGNCSKAVKYFKPPSKPSIVPASWSTGKLLPNPVAKMPSSRHKTNDAPNRIPTYDENP